MSFYTAPREQVAYNYKSLNQIATETLGNLIREPDNLVVSADIIPAISCSRDGDDAIAGQ
jgi:hypothetical protein